MYLLRWLFVDSKVSFFKGSRLLNWFDKFSNSRISMIFFGLSLICLWYNSLFMGLGFNWIADFNLGAVFLILSLLFCNKQRILSTKAIIYLVLFLLSLLVSSLWATTNGIELGMLFQGTLLMSQFVIAFIVASTYKSKIILVNTILFLSLPHLLVGMFQGFWGDMTSKLWVSKAENLIDVRVIGLLGNPNVLGSLTMITAIIALFAFFDKKKWYYLVYELLAITVLVMTFSRSAWIGLGVGIIVAILIKNWKLIIFAPIGLLTLLIPSVRQRIFVAASQEYLVDAAIDGRIWSFNNAVGVFKTSPVIGTGPGTYGGSTAIYYDSPIYLRGMQNGYIAIPYTDNQWVQILVQVGIVGTIFVLGFFISHLVNNLRQYIITKHYINLGVIAATIAVIIDGTFANIWEFGAIAVLAGAYLGLGNNNEE